MYWFWIGSHEDSQYLIRSPLQRKGTRNGALCGFLRQNVTTIFFLISGLSAIHLAF